MCTMQKLETPKDVIARVMGICLAAKEAPVSHCFYDARFVFRQVTSSITMHILYQYRHRLGALLFFRKKIFQQ